MRAPFRESAEALRAAGYRHSWGQDNRAIVFGGDLVTLDYFAGGSYNNRGRRYVPASLTVRPRHVSDANRIAVQRAAAANPDLVRALQRVPRSDSQAEDILRLAAELDRLAADHLPAAREAVAAAQATRDAEWRERDRAMRRLNAAESMEALLRDVAGRSGGVPAEIAARAAAILAEIDGGPEAMAA